MKKHGQRMLVIFAALSSLAAPVRGSTTEQQKNLDIFAAELGKSGDPRCHVLDKECLLFLSDQPMATLHGLSYEVIPGNKPQINLNIGIATLKNLNKLFERYPEKRLAVTYQGKVLFAPTIKDKLKGPSIQLSFNDQATFKKVVKALGETQLTTSQDQ